MANDVTDLLLAWNAGHKEALDKLVPLVTEELHRLAAIYLKRESGTSLQPTALVNELYLKLVDRKRVSWENRAHFFGFAATAMRRILVDHARVRLSVKRGAGYAPVTLEDAGLIASPKDIDVLALDFALKELAELEPRMVKLVELRFFAGLTIEETVEVMGISHTTVKRDWRTAKAFLLNRLKNHED